MEERARLCRQIDSQAKKVKQPKDKLYRKKMTTVEMLRFEPGDTYLMPHHIITINKKCKLGTDLDPTVQSASNCVGQLRIVACLDRYR